MKKACFLTIRLISGTAGRDNDAPDEYGSVVYIYNENSVRIYAPNKYTNGYDSGYTIFTGNSLTLSLSLSLSLSGAALAQW